MPRAFLATSLLVAVGLAACAAAPPSAPVVPAADVPEPVERPPVRVVSAPDPFPAGRGVTHVQDELYDAMRETAQLRAYADRLAALRTRLADEGETVDGTTVWRGVGAKNITGPFDCYELAISPSGASNITTVFRTDRKHCGLPYRLDATTAYNGPGARFTKRKLDAVMSELSALKVDDARTLARTRLNLPDENGVVAKSFPEPKVFQWSAVGARSDDAPITCWVLSITSRPRLERRELAACGIEWPPPLEAFAVHDSEPIEPVKASSAQAECESRCASNDVCVTTRATRGPTASMTARGDDLFAIGLDGRPLRIEVATACVPPPPTCAVMHMTCFFKPYTPPAPRDPGPCAAAPGELTFHSFGRASNGRWMITCNAARKIVSGVRPSAAPRVRS